MEDQPKEGRVTVQTMMGKHSDMVHDVKLGLKLVAPINYIHNRGASVLDELQARGSSQLEHKPAAQSPL